VYPDDAQKYAASAKQFADVADKFPRTRGGQLARYYQALSYEKIDKNDDAKKLLRGPGEWRQRRGGAFLARFELAQLDDRTGQGDEAVKLYQALIAKPSILAPKTGGHVGAGVALRSEQSCRGDQALRPDQVRVFQAPPIAEQADQALALLSGKILNEGK